MSRRKPSLKDVPTGIDREIGSKYDNVKKVADNLKIIEEIALGLSTSLKYLGASSTPPTERLEGSSLEDGDYYFDTTNGSESLVYYDISDNSWFSIDPQAVENNATQTQLDRLQTAEDVITTANNVAQTAADKIATAADVVSTNADKVQTALDVIAVNQSLSTKEPVFSKNTGFNKNLGNTAGTVAEGNHSHTKADILLGSVDNTSDLDKPISTATQTALDSKISSSLKGAVNGVAELDGSGKVPSGQLPAFVDDVLEYANSAAFPATGEASKIYIALNTNLTFRWTGTVYTEISKSLALGQTSSTAYRGDRGLAAYTHVSATNNPHGTTKDQVLLGSVDNTSDADKPISNLQKAVNDTIGAMTKAEFFALAEQRKSQSAGSGFSEWGKEYVFSGWWEQVNSGLSTRGVSGPWNALYMGGRLDGGDPSYYTGVSRTDYPIVNVNGTEHTILTANQSYGAAGIIFPPAPDGTKTFDSANGALVQHASSTIAFASETATNKVITTRHDFVFLESFHEKISDKDAVYPLGNVQFGASTWEGIALAINGIAQGYSAFGEWDAATTGNCAVWSTLSDADKEKFIQDPKNNIYSDNGELIQVRYRIRTIEGLGDEWDNTSDIGPAANYLAYKTTPAIYVTPQGSSLTATDFNGATVGIFSGVGSDWSFGGSTKGQFEASKGSGGVSVPYAHNGLCFAVPITLVQRLNKGAYNLTYNPYGCGNTKGTGADASRIDLPWYDSRVFDTQNTADCFDTSKASTLSLDVNSGTIAGGPTKSGTFDDKYHDAVYAGQVKDLRVSARSKTPNELIVEYSHKAFVGDTRGFESVPFTTSSVAGTGLHASANTIWAWDSGDNFVIYTDIDWTVGDWFYLYDTTQNFIVRFKATQQLNDDRVIMNGVSTSSSFQVVSGAVLQDTNGLGNTAYVLHETLASPQFKDLPWQDVIGSPANISATFPGGVFGQWIPNSTQPFTLNRKALTGTRTYTTDNGATWIGGANLGTFNSTLNQVTDAYTASHVALLQYKTSARPYEIANNSEVVVIGDVFVGSSSDVQQGNSLVSGLIGKVPTSAIAGSKEYEILGKPTGYALTSSLFMTADSLNKPKNIPFNPANHSTASPALKAFPYITSENGQYFLQWVYKEMVWGGADYGDDNTFTIVNGESTIADDNGNQIIIGQKRVALPYFTGEA